jgi:hypothetical protein
MTHPLPRHGAFFSPKKFSGQLATSAEPNRTSSLIRKKKLSSAGAISLLLLIFPVAASER